MEDNETNEVELQAEDDQTVTVDPEVSGGSNSEESSLSEKDKESLEFPDEDKVLEKIEAERNPQTKGNEVNATAKAADSKGTTELQEFELGNGLKIKADTEQLKELERGYLRQADYTKKTQEISAIKEEAQGIMQQVDAIGKDPRLLFNHFKPEYILAAFNPQYLLGHIMPKIGVSPQQWESFLQWQAENGESVPQGATTYTPQAQHLSRMEQEIHDLRSKLNEWENSGKERARTQAMKSLDTEVDQVLSEFKEKGVSKKALLRMMAEEENTRFSIQELAQQIVSEKDAEFQNYLKQKEQLAKKRVTAPRGRSVPIARKEPTTFDEADALYEQELAAQDGL